MTFAQQLTQLDVIRRTKIFRRTRNFLLQLIVSRFMIIS